MQGWTEFVLIVLLIPAMIGAIWALILMWRNSKALFLVNIFIPLFPAIYFYVKYWREDNVQTALYLQIPALLFILFVIAIT